jgi:hypothetical protein
MDGQEPAVALESTVLAWPGEDTAEHAGSKAEVDGRNLWGRSRDFDWGD